MRKNMLIIIMVLIMLLSTGVIYAVEGEVVQPYYIGTTSVSTDLKISGGNATMTAVLRPVNEEALDRVNITIELFKDNASIYSGSFNTYYDDTFMTFKKVVVEDLDGRGSYYVKATFKCYKSGTLIETISKASGTVTY